MFWYSDESSEEQLIKEPIANRIKYFVCITLCFSPDGNEKPAKEKQIDFVAKKERPKKLLFLLTKFLFFLWT
jgi:hypothetical protein